MIKMRNWFSWTDPGVLVVRGQNARLQRRSGVQGGNVGERAHQLQAPMVGPRHADSSGVVTSAERLKNCGPAIGRSRSQTPVRMLTPVSIRLASRRSFQQSRERL